MVNVIMVKVPRIRLSHNGVVNGLVWVGRANDPCAQPAVRRGRPMRWSSWTWARVGHGRYHATAALRLHRRCAFAGRRSAWAEGGGRKSPFAGCPEQRPNPGFWGMREGKAQLRSPGWPGGRLAARRLGRGHGSGRRLWWAVAGRVAGRVGGAVRVARPGAAARFGRVGGSCGPSHWVPAGVPTRRVGPNAGLVAAQSGCRPFLGTPELPPGGAGQWRAAAHAVNQRASASDTDAARQRGVAAQTVVFHPAVDPATRRLLTPSSAVDGHIGVF